LRRFCAIEEIEEIEEIDRIEELEEIEKVIRFQVSGKQIKVDPTQRTQSRKLDRVLPKDK